MKFVLFLFVILFAFLFTGCTSKMLSPVDSGSDEEIECMECPQFSPPATEFCEGGRIIPGEVDKCGCQMPPKCEYD